MQTNVIIADSSELILQGLKNIFEQISESNTFLAPDATSLENYISTVAEPLLVIDYTSSGFSLDNVVKLKNENVNLKILAITPYTNANTIVQAVQAGVESHLKKECSISAKKLNIKTTIFCDDIVKQMRNEQIDIEKIQFKSLDPSTVQLSERELQIIQFIAEGYTNSQIAAIVYLSNHTINTHRKNIMKKLGVNNTAGIVMYAVKTEMVSPNQFSFKKSKDHYG